MTVFDRLQYNFDTERFDGASNLSPAAANTINLVANNTPQLEQWQKTDLENGNIVRTNYFENPTANFNSSMLISCGNIALNSLACANANSSLIEVFNSANTLVISLNIFQSHTDNISGVTVVTSPDVPSYDTSSGYGQMNMMNLSKSDGTPSNTVPILGSFTSLFIQDILQANSSNLSTYSTQLKDSISISTDLSGNTIYTTNLSPTEITNIKNYMDSTSNTLIERVNHDWTFFRNTIQVTKDSAFLQQFTNMGGTNSYLVEKVVGTDSLVNKITTGT